MRWDRRATVQKCLHLLKKIEDEIARNPTAPEHTKELLKQVEELQKEIRFLDDTEKSDQRLKRIIDIAKMIIQIWLGLGQ